MEGVRPMETVLAALITGAVTLIGVLIANSRSQAVTDTKLEELTREVRAHNNFCPARPRAGRADEGGKPPHRRFRSKRTYKRKELSRERTYHYQPYQPHHLRRYSDPYRSAGPRPDKSAAQRSGQVCTAHRQRLARADDLHRLHRRCSTGRMVEEQQLHP